MKFLGVDLVNVNSVSAFEAGAGSSFVPVRLEVSEVFSVPARKQVLFTEEIDLGLGAEVDFGDEAILVEVT